MSRNKRNVYCKELYKPLKKEKFIRDVPKLTPANNKQSMAISELNRGVCMMFLTGSAGTGKSLIAAYFAAKKLALGEARKVFLARPYVMVGESIGAIPGTIDDKLLPMFLQTKTHIAKFLGIGETEALFNDKTIELAAVQNLRGTSFEDCIVIVEEAQNLSIDEMKMLVTRVGNNCTMIFTGDQTQTDLLSNSGLNWITKLVSKLITTHPAYLNKEDISQLSDNVSIVEFSPDDVVRHGLTKAFVKSFYFS